MNTFVNNLANSKSVTPAFTENGALAYNTTSDSLVDLFFNIGASRGKDITELFSRAYNHDHDLAVRLLLWARDARGGAGERQTFRNLLVFLAKIDSERTLRIVSKIPELGRWDDLLALDTDKVSPDIRQAALGLFAEAIRNGHGLACKWAPRKGLHSVSLRDTLGLSPKSYRKLIVAGSRTVEQAMCAKEWDRIVYSAVPSVAMARYRKSFSKNDLSRFQDYLNSVSRGEQKINASAVFPHDVIRNVPFYNIDYFSGTEAQATIEQWNALPNYIPEGVRILPMSDVSGSMEVKVSGSVSALHISVGLGVYCAERQKSAFKNVWLNFSSTPSIQVLKGDNIVSKIRGMDRDNWGMSTNIDAAFRLILDHAVQHRVSRDEMPNFLLIISDMQFNPTMSGRTNYEDAKARFNGLGYDLPQVVFWNVNARASNFPTLSGDRLVQMISGYSPAVLKNVLLGKNVTPLDTVLDVINNERYSF